MHLDILIAGHLVVVTFFPYYTFGGAIKALDLDTGEEVWSLAGVIGRHNVSQPQFEKISLTHNLEH